MRTYAVTPQEVVQEKGPEPATSVAEVLNDFKKGVAQRQADASGLPAPLRAGLESLGGVSLEGLRVHPNSSLPAQIAAHAFTQGSDIYLAPGQEKHLPHEGWHAVQQKQGRVQPTAQLAGGVNLNDQPELEREADAMGQKAALTNVDVSVVDTQAKHIEVQHPPRTSKKDTSTLLADVRPSWRVIQLQRYRSTFSGPSIGTEQELTGCSIKLGPKTERGLIATVDRVVGTGPNREDLLYVETDMGNGNNEYTIELITTPTERSDTDGLAARREATKVIMDILLASDFNGKLVSAQGLRGLDIKVAKPNHHITRDHGLGQGSQVTVGYSEFNEVDTLLSDASWYEKSRYMLTGAADEEEKFIYNYVACIIIYIAELLTPDLNADITAPQFKNSWNILPRTAPKKIIEERLSEAQRFLVKQNLSALPLVDGISAKALNKAKEMVLMDGFVPSKHAVDATIENAMGKKQKSFVFEIRAPSILKYKDFLYPHGEVFPILSTRPDAEFAEGVSSGIDYSALFKGMKFPVGFDDEPDDSSDEW